MPHTVGGPAPTSARQGREQQKYGPDGERLVAGCIPVRYVDGKTGASSVEVLMITSRGSKGFVFPKGGWEVDETVEMAAQRETVEEAGVRGELELPLLGTFPFARSSQKGRCRAFMFAMVVSEELDSWPEASQRLRAWCSLWEAHGRARYDWMRDALGAFITRKGWDLASVVGEAAAASPGSADLACMSPSPTDAATLGPSSEVPGAQCVGPEPHGIAVQS